MGKGSIAAVLCALAVLVLMPALAFGYAEGSASRALCVDCHGSAYLAPGSSPTTSTADTQTVTGPHMGYTSTSRKCQTCHQVHVAPSANLLPAATIVATCNVCHDGSGGGGVYGVLLARGVTPAQVHRVGTGATNVVPGGDPDTGNSRAMTFRGPGGALTCTDCHTPHGQNIVTAFTGDRKRVASPISPNPKSSRLLKNDPGGTGKDIVEYGSNWCLACHAGRGHMNTPSVVNHPVATDTVAVYDRLLRLASDDLTGSTETSTLGGSNRGFLMTSATLATLRGSDSGPICQQCHEDARSVGQLNVDGTQGDPATFVVTTPDGGTPTDNPQFQVFPHESVTEHFLVEENDDLCYGNCHKVMN
jgi:predicted CXXCH cytochrome family protein